MSELTIGGPITTAMIEAIARGIGALEGFAEGCEAQDVLPDVATVMRTVAGELRANALDVLVPVDGSPSELVIAEPKATA